MDPASLQNVLVKWHPEIVQRAPNVPYILVGLSTEKRERRSPVCLPPFCSAKAGFEVARKIEASGFVECSWVHYQNIQRMVEIVSRVLLGVPLVTTVSILRDSRPKNFGTFEKAAQYFTLTTFEQSELSDDEIEAKAQSETFCLQTLKSVDVSTCNLTHIPSFLASCSPACLATCSLPLSLFSPFDQHIVHLDSTKAIIMAAHLYLPSPQVFFQDLKLSEEAIDLLSQSNIIKWSNLSFVNFSGNFLTSLPAFLSKCNPNNLKTVYLNHLHFPLLLMISFLHLVPL